MQRLDLSPHQPLEEIKTITITLQLNDLTRWSILPAQLLGPKQAPVPLNTQNPSADATIVAERDDLLGMQPVTVIQRLELGVEARAAERFVDSLERGEDAREERLEGEWGEVRREEGGRTALKITFRVGFDFF